MRRKGTPEALAAALFGLGVPAEVTGRLVRAWVPGRGYLSVLMVPGWRRDRWRLPRRIWTWRSEGAEWQQPRADTGGAASAALGLLARMAAGEASGARA